MLFIPSTYVIILKQLLSLDCLLSVFFDDYMSKLFPIFYLANFVCFYPSRYKAFPPNIKLHLFDPPVYEIDCFNTDQVMSKSCLLSFSFQIYFESSVSLEYLLWLKDLMWFLYLFKCACCHAYVVFCAICVACSDCGLVNYVFSHAFFLERACFLVPASA